MSIKDKGITSSTPAGGGLSQCDVKGEILAAEEEGARFTVGADHSYQPGKGREVLPEDFHCFLANSKTDLFSWISETKYRVRSLKGMASCHCGRWQRARARWVLGKEDCQGPP